MEGSLPCKRGAIAGFYGAWMALSRRDKSLAPGIYCDATLGVFELHTAFCSLSIIKNSY